MKNAYLITGLKANKDVFDKHIPTKGKYVGFYSRLNYQKINNIKKLKVMPIRTLNYALIAK